MTFAYGYAYSRAVVLVSGHPIELLYVVFYWVNLTCFSCELVGSRLINNFIAAPFLFEFLSYDDFSDPGFLLCLIPN